MTRRARSITIILPPPNSPPASGRRRRIIRPSSVSPGSNGLDVAATHDSRLLLDVNGRAGEVEKAFHVTLRTYQHPAENRRFFAPDVAPTVDSRLPDFQVNGLSDFSRLRPMARLKPSGAWAGTAGGSGPGSNYLGQDFRAAYAAAVTLNGAGQTVGLFESDGYYASDISNYERLAGLPNVPLVNVFIDEATNTPGANDGEVAMDIELAIAMAPGLSAVVVFQSPETTPDWLDILDSMASSNQIRQFSSSWGYTGRPDPNGSFDAEFQKMATQGQSFFQAAGDGDAWVNPIYTPADSPYVTSVGGTTLTMTGAGAAYGSETVWNAGDTGDVWPPNGNGYQGSGGGVSGAYEIPSWQQSVSMAANAGSTNMRNIPDVALTADDVWVLYNNGESNSFIGTSAAAPLWAGLAALANQQAASLGQSPVGFINPAVYAIGQGVNYNACFHDITNGNNTNAQSHGLYSAVAGYDLCCGWGTPIGGALINALAPLGPLQILPAGGFAANGAPGGPFSTNSQTYLLTNAGAAALNWAAAAGAPWLGVSPAGGALAPGAPAVAVTVRLNAAASNETLGTYSAPVWFTNFADSVVQNRAFTLNVIPPPSFTLVPTNQAVFAGATVTFTAAATSTTPLTYQWQQNGANLADGAALNGSSTTALTLSSVTAASAGSYTVVASNPGAAVTSAPPAVLTVVPSPQLIQNGGFETGSFSGWTGSGNFYGQNFIVSGTAGNSFVHTGHYGAELGSDGSLGYLAQSVPTQPGQLYAISVWLNNTSGQSPSEFSVAWNGVTLYDRNPVPLITGWTNLQFTVTSAVTNSVLQFGFRDDPAFLGLDDISVLPLRAELESAGPANGTITLTWIALPNAVYQVQSITNLAQTNWTNLGGPMTGAAPILTATDTVKTNTATFYRVVLAP